MRMAWAAWVAWVISLAFGGSAEAWLPQSRARRPHTPHRARRPWTTPLVLHGSRVDALNDASTCMQDVAGELDSAALGACSVSLKAAAAECESDWEATTIHIYEASEHLAAASKEDGPLPDGARPKIAAAAEALRYASECGGARAQRGVVWFGGWCGVAWRGVVWCGCS